MGFTLSYGVLGENPDGTPYIFSKYGQDLIVTQDDGSLVSYGTGNISWVLTCTALVWIMIPGLGFLYSGLVRRKNALALLLMTMLALATISIQWFLIGFSLAFSDTGGSFFGNLDHFGFIDVLEKPSGPAGGTIPDIVYAVFQLTFAALVPAIHIGAACERGRVGPTIIFCFCWTTLCYCPLAHWVWAPQGWAFKWGILDYAGGGPIEIASGITGLAYSLYLGRRYGYGTEKLAYKPHNLTHVVIGTVFLWFGWLGFNGGSTFAANLKAGLALFNTNLAAAVGGFVWMLLDLRLERKWSVIGFCTGSICGLVYVFSGYILTLANNVSAITPAAGFIGAPASLAVGAVASAVSNLSTSVKIRFGFDDPLDIFSCHALSGMVGVLMTGLFAQAPIAANDALTVIEGGWVDHNWKQMYKQFTWVVVATGWTFVTTILIMFVIDHIPYCGFRASQEAEIIGTDEDQCGEFAYDYVHAHRDIEAAGWDVHNFQDMQQLTEGADSNKTGESSDPSSATAGRPDMSEKRGADVIESTPDGAHRSNVANEEKTMRHRAPPTNAELQQSALSPRR